MYYIGAHLSSINIIESLRLIQSYNGNMIQIFVSSPIGKQKKNIIEDYQIKGPEIKKYLIDNNLKIVIHSPYTLNFAREFNKNNYIFDIIFKELKIANLIGAIGCVIHVGKYLDINIKYALNNMYLSIKYIIEYIKKERLNVYLILETSAGQGTELLVTENNDIDELSNFYAKFTEKEKEILKICIDTCHIYSAGFDIRIKKNIKKFFILIKNLIGLENIVLIHLNDSKTEYNSHKDRHEKLGKGTIGLKGLQYFVKYALKYNYPIILETCEESYNKEISWINKIKNKIK
jgi:deoxyribonuclease-4